MANKKMDECTPTYSMQNVPPLSVCCEMAIDPKERRKTYVWICVFSSDSDKDLHKKFAYPNSLEWTR